MTNDIEIAGPVMPPAVEAVMVKMPAPITTDTPNTVKSHQFRSRLRKDLNWWDLTVFGVSVVIGAGIFTITASTAGGITGPAISISFVIAAVACGLAALCYAEFA